MFRYSTTLKLRDTDAAGVAFFAAYFAIAHDAYESFLISQGAHLRSWLGDPGGYKSDPDLRAVLLDRLEAAAPVRIEPPARREAIASDHVFDAVICVVAAADFATGRTPPVPTALHQVARTEGWIHVR